MTVCKQEDVERELMDEKNFKSPKDIKKDIKDGEPGLYCIRINDIHLLPLPFNEILASRGHKILYIGIARTSLKKRFLEQELRAQGHGTFFRSLGAILGYVPEKGSLKGKGNRRNYKFLRKNVDGITNEELIVQWINDNLKVNCVEFKGDFESAETSLIKKHKPLLNIAKNEEALEELKKLRAECVRIANADPSYGRR